MIPFLSVCPEGNAMDFVSKEKYGINDLIEIMKMLRSENGCPWDREQTHQSIRKNLIEETYEAVEAIDKEDAALLKEELGDVLLQVVFHAKMEEEAGRFCFDDVADGICKKLIIRHPHIFSNVVADTPEQVLANWDKIKKEEKGQQTAADTLLAVSSALPALMRAQKVQQRAARVGFDYENIGQAMADLSSELAELKEALAAGNQADTEEELGDLMFAAVNVARFLKADSEEALTGATEKFIRRFEQVERLAKKENIDMQTAPLTVLDELWKAAKQNSH